MQCDWNASYAIAKPNRPDWRRPLGSISLSQIHAGLSTALSLGNFRTYRGGFDWPILPNGMAARHRGCPVTTRRAAALRRFPASRARKRRWTCQAKARGPTPLSASWPDGPRAGSALLQRESEHECAIRCGRRLFRRRSHIDDCVRKFPRQRGGMPQLVRQIGNGSFHALRCQGRGE